MRLILLSLYLASFSLTSVFAEEVGHDTGPDQDLITQRSTLFQSFKVIQRSVRDRFVEDESSEEDDFPLAEEDDPFGFGDDAAKQEELKRLKNRPVWQKDVDDFRRMCSKHSALWSKYFDDWQTKVKYAHRQLLLDLSDSGVAEVVKGNLQNAIEIHDVVKTIYLLPEDPDNPCNLLPEDDHPFAEFVKFKSKDANEDVKSFNRRISELKKNRKAELKQFIQIAKEVKIARDKLVGELMTKKEELIQEGKVEEARKLNQTMKRVRWQKIMGLDQRL